MRAPLRAYATAGMTEVSTIVMFTPAEQPGGCHVIEDHLLEEVIDPQGREFSYSSEASIWADDSLDWYDEINPGNVVEGAIYFDVPVGTALHYVELDTGWFSEPTEISLQ